MLTNVLCPQAVSRGGGSFADVYYGTMGDIVVAIKRLRTHSAAVAPTDEQKLQLERVRGPFCVFSSCAPDTSGLCILGFLS